ESHGRNDGAQAQAGGAEGGTPRPGFGHQSSGRAGALRSDQAAAPEEAEAPSEGRDRQGGKPPAAGHHRLAAKPGRRSREVVLRKTNNSSAKPGRRSREVALRGTNETPAPGQPRPSPRASWASSA